MTTLSLKENFYTAVQRRTPTEACSAYMKIRAVTHNSGIRIRLLSFIKRRNPFDIYYSKSRSSNLFDDDNDVVAATDYFEVKFNDVFMFFWLHINS